MLNTFQLPETDDLVDLGRYLDRAKRMDPVGAVRLRAYGDVLTVYVAPLFAGEYSDGSSVMLGLRTMALAKPTEFDLTVGITALAECIQNMLAGVVIEEKLSLADRLANLNAKKELASNEVTLNQELVNVAWSAETPTRTGWILGGEIVETELTEIARKGIAEVTETLPSSVGGPIAARVRSEIWSRAFDYKFPIPMGAAFIAAGLGFLTEGEMVSWYVSGDWIRLSSQNGHVLAKFARDYVPTEI
ncbi:MAG: hypothetical protein F2662_00040 [Actinobacteria bacterium]|uniref:Unannotated protein n=1 Tax=freshwater metagenome TaxID=449393 RepID=A0A6J6MU44_9ZZZZ|nr:hypothetical protein [Actinomycetota bacterium]